ncbi:TPA_asm: hypothetical protein vir526_00046 [Caudoviricetes sp. vir526]|nr:TPA_asm: hypothetical protein vir526_00046 [Caudoviricetes sp. vir526]
MRPAVQKWFATIGSEGCFALSIIEGGRQGCSECDAVKLLDEGQRRGFLDPEFLVLKHAEFMSLVAGGEWTYQKLSTPEEIASYKPQPGDVTVEEWVWKYQHFMLRRNGQLIDTLGDSQTRLRGKMASIRLFRRKSWSKS